MRQYILFSALLLLMPTVIRAEVNIIPQPTQVTEKAGSFVLKPSATIAYSDKSLLPAAQYLQEKLRPLMAEKPRGQQLARILITDAPLPRTATGKIKRWELQQKMESAL